MNTKKKRFFKTFNDKNCDKTFGKSILEIFGRRLDVWLTSLSSQRVKKNRLTAKKTIGNGMFF